jgi:Ca2+-binding EF-hand superfamily protein
LLFQGFNPKQYVKGKLTEENVIKLKECFDIFDYDGSGNISGEELINTIKALGIEAQATQIIGIVNASGESENMDFQIFLDIFGFSGDGNSEASIGQLFEAFDINKQGSFGPEEFEKVAASVGENFSAAEVDQMIDYADKDRDGGINYDEFVNVITREYPKV